MHRVYLTGPQLEALGLFSAMHGDDWYISQVDHGSIEVQVRGSVVRENFTRAIDPKGVVTAYDAETDLDVLATAAPFTDANGIVW